MRHFFAPLATRRKTRQRRRPSAQSRRAFRAECLERRLMLSATPLETHSIDANPTTTLDIFTLTSNLSAQPPAVIQIDGGFIASDTPLVVLQINGQSFMSVSLNNAVDLGGITRNVDSNLEPQSDFWLSVADASTAGSSTVTYRFDSDGAFIPRVLEPILAPTNPPDGGPISIPSVAFRISAEVKSPESGWTSPSVTAVGREESTAKTSLTATKPADISGEWAHAAVFSFIGEAREPSTSQISSQLSSIPSAKPASLQVEKLSSPVRAATNDAKSSPGNTYSQPSVLPSDPRGSDSNAADSRHHTTSWQQLPVNRESVPKVHEQDGFISRSATMVTQVAGAGRIALLQTAIGVGATDRANGQVAQSTFGQFDVSLFFGEGKHRSFAASLLTVLALDWIATVNSRQPSKSTVASTRDEIYR